MACASCLGSRRAGQLERAQQRERLVPQSARHHPDPGDFAEVDYDKNPKNDPQPGGSDQWHKGELPTWKDDLFDPFPLTELKAEVSRYYRDVSLGQFTVLGDYIDQVVTLRESEQRGLRDWSGMAWEAANILGSLHTAHDISITDFDQWTDGESPAYPS
ncbi:MAG: hypothetical protein IPI05_16725 [Flavobacteriales bacterium]|nr:hypothetical protein [Flavobacteriales bacterium]